MAFAQQLDAATLQKLRSSGGQPLEIDGFIYFPDADSSSFSSLESGGSGRPEGAQTGWARVPVGAAKSSRMIDAFGLDGVYQDSRKDTYTNPLADVAKFAAAAYGLNALGGALTSGITATAVAPVQSSITGLTDTLAGIAPASSSMIPEATFAISPGVGGAVGGAAGAGLAARAVPSSITGLSDTLSGVAPATSAGIPAFNPAVAPGVSGVGGIAKALGSLGPVLGAVGGALSSKDQDQNATSTSKTVKDPYAPAKPFIDQQIAQGQSLASQYQQNPFSSGQKQAYNNLTGLLGAINGNLGGLLGGMNAASSGANNFDRANPRKALTGSSFNLSGYAPGLLNLFGG